LDTGRIRGDESRGLGRRDYKDVMAGVHDLVNRGIADGIDWELRGWSYADT